VWRSSTDLLQAGLRNVNIAAVDIAAPILSSEARPPKRHFAEIDEGGEEPDSDELYDWMDDDDVAAEGLLIGEAPTMPDGDPATSGATALAAPSDASLVEEHNRVTRPPTS
jgi:hypothetical protein